MWPRALKRFTRLLMAGRRDGTLDSGQIVTLVNLDPRIAATLQAIAWETVCGNPW